MIRISHSMPWLGTGETKAVTEVIRSRYLAGGPQLEKLERELSIAVGHKYGFGVSSGTAALYIALRALKVSHGDKVVVPSYSCTALLNAVIMAGAAPVFVDVDPDHGNCTGDTIRKSLCKGVKALIVPHLFGYPADIKEISRVGLPVIEDCAQCVGARRNGTTVGGSSIISVFSFYATKLLAAGEGGLIAVSDKSIAQQILDNREYDKRETFVPSFNFKLSDVHASIARVQLAKLGEIIKKRRKLAAEYRKLLEGPGIELPISEPGVEPVYYRFVVRVAEVDKTINKLLRSGIESARPVFKPLHTYFNHRSFPGTQKIFAHALSVPIYPSLSLAGVREICDILKKSEDTLT